MSELPRLTLRGEFLRAERHLQRAVAAEKRLNLARLVEQDMAEAALAAWRSADARRELSDHAALEVYADALTRWSERLRMAFDGEDYRDDRTEDAS